MSFQGFKHDLQKGGKKNPTKIPLLSSKRDFPHWILLCSSSRGQPCKIRRKRGSFIQALGCTWGHLEKGVWGVKKWLWRKIRLLFPALKVLKEKQAGKFCLYTGNDGSEIHENEWGVASPGVYQLWQIRIRNWTLWPKWVHSNPYPTILLEKGFSGP